MLDYAVIEKLEHGEDYQITPKEDNIPTDEDNGTTIILRDLKLKNSISEEIFMRSMARRFSVLSDKFQVKINNKLLKKTKAHFKSIFLTIV